MAVVPGVAATDVTVPCCTHTSSVSVLHVASRSVSVPHVAR
jgi:hypothetical protein